MDSYLSQIVFVRSEYNDLDRNSKERIDNLIFPLNGQDRFSVPSVRFARLMTANKMPNFINSNEKLRTFLRTNTEERVIPENKIADQESNFRTDSLIQTHTHIYIYS